MPGKLGGGRAQQHSLRQQAQSRLLEHAVMARLSLPCTISEAAAKLLNTKLEEVR